MSEPKTRSDQILDLLRDADPVDVDALRRELGGDYLEAARVRAVTREPDIRYRRQRPRTARLITAAVAGAATIAVVAALLPGGAGKAAPDAARALKSVAAIAAAETSPPANRGFTYYKLREAFYDYRGWVSAATEHWVAPDDSGRIRKVRYTGEFIDSQGSPRPEDRVGVSDKRFGAGELGGPSYEGCLPPTRKLPADPDRLAEIFRETREECSGAVPLNAKSFEYAASVLLQAGSSPELRAALYEVVANIDDVELVGDARDPHGRLGTAVSLDHDYGGRPERYELFFDPETSQPLAFTENLTEEQPWIDGLLIQYNVLVESGHVPSLDSRP